ncbi:MAG: glycerophosphodiester phosphodiesterase family protein [Deinococcota bacterium]
MSFAIIAHRGASADAPDNSSEAFNLAISQHADLIETDVRVTADDVLVLEHDASIPKENGEKLEVRYSTLAQLQAAKPHLLTVAAAVREFGAKIPFCWETKAAGLEHRLIYLLRDLLPETMWQRSEFTSFSLASVFDFVRLREQLGETFSVGWLTRQWDDDAIALARDNEFTQLCPPARRVLENPELVARAVEQGLQVRVWLVETPEMAAELFPLDVYGGTVNFPGAVAAHRDSAVNI